MSGTTSGYPLWWGCLTFFLALIALVLLGRHTDVLRDSQPADFGGAKPPSGEYRRPYSLAQTQMAIWFCIILASFLFIWLVKDDLNNILNDCALILLGIGTGTAVGAAIIEQTKGNNFTTLHEFNQVLAQIASQQQGASPVLIAQRDELAAKLASENLFIDLLTDENGVSLHRFQSLLWTAVLSAIFVIYVVKHLGMPTFDTLTLAVLGISGGTYLGFKIPEQPA